MKTLPNIKLELPDLKYKDSFLYGVKEFTSLKNRNFTEKQYDIYRDVTSDEDFQNRVVQPKLDEMAGRGLKEGYVPATDFWIIETNENGREEYAGRISLRHRLTESLCRVGGHIGYDIVPGKRGRGYAGTALRLALKKAEEMGISQVLITCDENNEPSKRTITGVLKEYGGKEDETIVENGLVKLRFRINTRRN